MKRIPSRRAAVLAALLSCLLLPAVFLAQGTGAKALVVCPPSDAAGCDRIATQLALATNGGSPVFPGGVDKKYTELRTMSLSQLQSYSAVFVPSLANAPYDLLRESVVQYRLGQVLRGRVAVLSGTPDRGVTTGTSAGKLTLIQNLGRWAAAQHSTDGTTGLVALQDFSDARPDGSSPRYDWIQGISGVSIAPVTTVRTYAQLEKNGANPAAAAIAGSLAYDNMASFGLAAPSSPGVVGAWGQTINGKKTSRGDAVLVTAARAKPASYLMTPAGGTINAQDGKVKLVFPAGAVSEPVSIVVDKAVVSETNYVPETAYSFAPSMTFATPVSLTISYLESNIPGGIANESKLVICEYKASAWSPVPGSTVNTAANTVTAPIDHFSRYAIFMESCGSGGGGGGGKGAPTAVNDTYAASEDTPLVVAAPGVLANDTDPQGDPLTAVLVSGPAQGTLTLNPNGSFTYTPAANFSGTATFTYKANDGRRDSNTATVTINVAGTNDVPVAVNDAYSTPEDTPLSVAAPGVLGNDTDADGNPLSALLVSGPANGTLTLNANGSLSYTPNAGFNGTDQFTYKANDGTVDSNVATVTITVDDVNDAPVAVNDAYTTDEDVALVVAAPGVLANDTDPEGTALTAAVVAGPAHGSLTLNPNGSFTYTPAANYNGPDSFTYKASDGTTDSNVATVTLTVNPVNDAPAAVNDAYTTDEDVALVVAAPGVLANDTDPEGTALTAAVVAGPAHGSLTLNPNGSFTYTPAANYNGPDSFTYKANDGTADSNVATVSITVNGVAEAPTAVNDAYSTDEDTPLNVSAPGVLANDTDPEGNALTAVLVSTTSNGTLALNANGSFTYTPNAGYNGSDSFTYKANDGGLDSNVATVTITVATVNDPPTAVNDAYSTDEDVALNVTAPGVLTNDTDPESNALTAVLVSGPTNGTLTLNPDGSFTYTPNPNYNGSDSFTYKANDGTSDSNVATVSITVNGVAEAPTAANDAYSTDEDVALNVTAPGVLGNDSDPEGSALTAVLVSTTSNGTLALNANGSFTYTPNAGYNGSDSFTYKANDGALDSNVATVTITVSSVNDAPIAVNDAYSTDEDVALNVTAPGVLTNDTDPEGTALTAAVVAGPAHGSLTLNANGSFTYTPAANYNGPDSFTYKANDGTSDSNVATVTLTVNSVVDVPVATNDAYSTNEDNPLAVIAPGVLGNDSNPEGGTLSAVLVSTTSNGSLTLNADGSFTYTPNANYFGSDSFTYKGNNGTGDSNVATVTITVNPVNDLPVAVADAYTTDEDTPLNVTAALGVLANDTDPEGNTLSAVQVTGPAHGTLTLNANGSFAYSPAANYFGPDQFTYKANDGFGDSNTVTVSITVNPVNDAPTAGADAFNAIGNVQVPVVASGVLANDSDIEGDALSVVAATVPSANGGTAVIQANGSFTYISGAGFNGTDTFNYTLSDGNLTSTGTVTMTVTGRYWFVDASAAAGGDGRQNSRFQSLTPLNGAGGAGDPDSPNDVILVFQGSYTSPIALEAGQQLIGQGIPANLTVTANGQTITLLTAGTSPTLGSASGNTVALSTGNTLRGLTLGNGPGAALFGSTFGTVTISELGINTTGQALSLTNGVISGNFAQVRSTGGTTNVLLSGVTGSGGTVALGTAADALSGATTDAFVLTGGAGSFTYAGSITHAGSGGLLNVTGGHTGTLTLPGTLSATGGTGLQFNNADGTYTFGGAVTLNGGNAGIDVANGSSGTFSFPSSTSINNPTGETVTIANSAPSFTYPGSLTKTNNSASGITLSANTGGTIAFSGATKVFSTGTANAVNLLNNGGATISFADSLRITTTTGVGFNATGGGTVTVAGTHNSITSTGGVALNVASTTIGAGGLNFRSISANGGSSGIVLNNTGTSGRLQVTGTGTAASGGTIQNTTGHGISLTTTTNPAFDRMSLQSNGGSGVFGTGVVGFTLTNSTIATSGTGGGANASNIDFFADTAPGTENNLSGTVVITGNTLSAPAFHSVDIQNWSGTISDLTLSNNIITNNSTLGGGIRVIAFGGAGNVAKITRATIAGNQITGTMQAPGLQVQCGNASAGGPLGECGTEGSATNVVAITGNQVRGAGAASRIGTEGLLALLNGRGQANFNVSTNDVRHTTGRAMAVTVFGQGRMTSTVSNNTIVANNTFAAAGLEIGADSTANMASFASYRATVTGNNISQTDGVGIYAIARGSSDSLRVKLQNNTIAAPLTGVRPGLRVDSGSTNSNTWVCANISGNTSAGSGGHQGIGLRKQGTVPTDDAFAVHGMAATSSPGVEAYVAGLNPAGGGVLLISATSGFTNCSFP